MLPIYQRWGLSLPGQKESARAFCAKVPGGFIHSTTLILKHSFLHVGGMVDKMMLLGYAR